MVRFPPIDQRPINTELLAIFDSLGAFIPFHRSYVSVKFASNLASLELSAANSLVQLALPTPPASPLVDVVQLGDQSSGLFALLGALSISASTKSAPAPPPCPLFPPNVGTTVPLTRIAPLNSFASLLRWRADYARDSLLVSSVPLLERPPLAQPQLLLCHDMKGGYTGDEEALVTWPPAAEPYIFTRWDKVDSFVYFSHTRVAVPPVGWVEAAHRHGVRVYGTVITEGDDGQRDQMLLVDPVQGPAIAGADLYFVPYPYWVGLSSLA